MHRDTAINIIKRKIINDHDGKQVDAAKAIGMHKNQLNRVLTGVQDEIPQKLLDWAKLGKVKKTTYIDLRRQ